MFQGGSSPSVCIMSVWENDLSHLLWFVTPYPWCLLQIYMTCVLKATLASAPSDALHKSCSFANGYVHATYEYIKGAMSDFSYCRWLAADGNHQVCACCDSTCGPDGGTAASPFGGRKVLLSLVFDPSST